MDRHLVCKGDTYPAQLMDQKLPDMACEQIAAGITRKLIGDKLCLRTSQTASDR